LQEWLSYLEYGIHSGNRNFNVQQIQSLLSQVEADEPDQNLINKAKQLISEYKNNKDIVINDTNNYE
jgi:hypothetical protein